MRKRKESKDGLQHSCVVVGRGAKGRSSRCLLSTTRYDLLNNRDCLRLNSEPKLTKGTRRRH